MNFLLYHEADEYIVMILNDLSKSEFFRFIKCIDQKAYWSGELCSCFFETANENDEYYQFETFEGNSYKMSYGEFLKYVELAIIRFYLGSKDDKDKETIKEVIDNTIFESVLDNVDPSLAIDKPLVG